MADTSKIAVVAEWPIPNTIKELYLFLGLAHFYHRFIKNFATTAAPLILLLLKNVVLRWGPTQLEAFDILKKSLVNHPVLLLPIF